MAAGVVSFLKARSTVKSDEVQRLLNTISGLEKRCDTLDEDFTRYKESAEKMIQEGRERARILDQRNDIMTKALNSAWRCGKIRNPMECVALSTLKELCDNNKGVCEVNI